jgi:hypothetical protein
MKQKTGLRVSEGLHFVASPTPNCPEAEGNDPRSLHCMLPKPSSHRHYEVVKISLVHGNQIRNLPDPKFSADSSCRTTRLMKAVPLQPRIPRVTTPIYHSFSIESHALLVYSSWWPSLVVKSIQRTRCKCLFGTRVASLSVHTNGGVHEVWSYLPSYMVIHGVFKFDIKVREFLIQ